MSMCCIDQCRNTRSKQKNTGITFHRIPKNANLRSKWQKALQWENWTTAQTDVICSVHFEESCMDRTSQTIVRLREHAVPTIFNQIVKSPLIIISDDDTMESSDNNQTELEKLLQPKQFESKSQPINPKSSDKQIRLFESESFVADKTLASIKKYRAEYQKFVQPKKFIYTIGKSSSFQMGSGQDVNDTTPLSQPLERVKSNTLHQVSTTRFRRELLRYLVSRKSKRTLEDLVIEPTEKNEKLVDVMNDTPTSLSSLPDFNLHIFNNVGAIEIGQYKKMFPNLTSIINSEFHCTSCNFHIGTALINEAIINIHPILRVTQCKNCFTFYNSRQFERGVEGNELYCRWCGQGGDVYCCSKCPFVFCRRCIVQNLSLTVLNEIKTNENWICLVCAPDCMLKVRAKHWALINFIEEQKRQIKLHFSDENEINDLINNDISKCCIQKPTPLKRQVQTEQIADVTPQKRRFITYPPHRNAKPQLVRKRFESKPVFPNDDTANDQCESVTLNLTNKTQVKYPTSNDHSNESHHEIKHTILAETTTSVKELPQAPEVGQPVALPPGVVTPVALSPEPQPQVPQSPVALLPVALPVVALPPVALPVVAVPPVALPPVALPPVVLPPVALPPVALPPVAVSPVALPAVALPPITLPSVALPPVALPPVAVPPVALPPVTLPPVAVPSLGLPPVALPPIGLPPVALPPVALPLVALPPETLTLMALSPVAQPIYYMINGFNIDLKLAAEQDMMWLPDGQIIQVKRTKQSDTEINPYSQEQFSNIMLPMQSMPTYFPLQYPVERQFSAPSLANVPATPQTIPNRPPPPPPLDHQILNLDSSIGKAKAQFDKCVDTSKNSCHNVIEQINTLIAASSERQIKSFADMRNLTVHLSHIIDYAVGQFKTLQGKCVEDLKNMASAKNKTIETSNDDNDIEIIEEKRTTIILNSDGEDDSNEPLSIMATSVINRDTDVKDFYSKNNILLEHLLKANDLDPIRNGIKNNDILLNQCITNKNSELFRLGINKTYKSGNTKMYGTPRFK